MYLVNVFDTQSYTLIDDYVIRPKAPKHLSALARKVTIDVVSMDEDERGNAFIAVRSDDVALCVVLTSLVEGHFDDNAFLLKLQSDLKVGRRH